MNDPGLEDPINDVSKEVDGGQYDGTEEEEEKAYLDPSRWWFASTACPLIAGTFGPMANAFSICALGSYWRQEVPPSGDETIATFIQDPHWLLAVNAVSLAFALVANASLLVNMAGRVRFTIAQPITIIGFAVAAILLIGLVGATSRQSFIGPQENHALTQAYYYAIWAAAIYIIVSALMTLTVVGALREKYPKEFNLTTSQRTLMLQTISFMAYLLIGALIFSALEGWHYLDAVYWADFTLLTIGIGSPLTPMTHAGRSLLIPFAIGGIITVGLIIGSIRSMLLETGKNKMRARTTEKTRSRVHSFADVKNHRPGLLPNSKKHSVPPDMPVGEVRRHEFEAMRRIQKRAITKSKWSSLLLSTLAGSVLWFIGALVFMHTEYQQDWSYFVSLYFSYTTLLTIGYGDYQPVSNSGRAFFVFWSLLAIPTLTVLISDMGDTVVQGIADATNWIGSLVLLPKDTGFAAAWGEIIASTTKIFRQKQQQEDKTDRELERSTQEPKQTDKDEHLDFAAMLRQRLGSSSLEHATSFAVTEGRTKRQHDQSFFRWLLVREINLVLLDTQQSQAKEYSYDEWKYFLRLLGHDEHKPELHRRPNPRPVRGPDDEPLIGRPIDKYGRIRPWSWMGIRSPLMSPKDESTWILQQLIAKMQREMDVPASSPEAEDEEESLPVSLDMLSGGERDSSLSGSSSKQDSQQQV